MSVHSGLGRHEESSDAASWIRARGTAFSESVPGVGASSSDDRGPQAILLGGLAHHLVSAFRTRADDREDHLQANARIEQMTPDTRHRPALIKGPVQSRPPGQDRGGQQELVDPPDPTYIPSDGGALAADIRRAAGPKSRGTIIFVHGFCGNKGENGLFQALGSHATAAGFDTVSYDWRGIGQSAGCFPSSTLDQHASDFEQVAQWSRTRFGDAERPMYAVGFSLGAAIIGLALKRRVALNSVAYLSPAVRPPITMWPRYNTDVIRRAIDRDGVVEKPGSSVLLGRAILESLRDTDLGPKAFDVDVPLLVCHGTADTRIDCSHTQELVATKDLASDFAYMQVDGASHSFRPEERCWQFLAAALASWFQSVHGRDHQQPASADGFPEPD